MNNDYLLEKRLRTLSPELHKIFSANVICCQNMLRKYQNIFPGYTDHTMLHSLEVISFCNELIGTQVEMLNADEIFVLLMAAYLHDSGMGISEKDYHLFLEELPMAKKYIEDHPEAVMADVIRTFHNEFAGCYIRKYASVFDLPSEKHLFAIIQVSRGHRKTDLWDKKEYPVELEMDNGNKIHLPYLAALIRLADEIDIAADRNSSFLYDISLIESERSVIEFKKHMAIRRLIFEQDSIRLLVDFSDESLREELYILFDKLNKTLSECVDVIVARTPFQIHQRKIIVESVNGE